MSKNISAANYTAAKQNKTSSPRERRLGCQVQILMEFFLQCSLQLQARQH